MVLVLYSNTLCFANFNWFFAWRVVTAIFCLHISIMHRGPSFPLSYGSWIYNYLCNHHWLMLQVRISIRARCTSLCDKVCQWLATGRWFSLGPPVTSTKNTDRHDITEILLKVALTIIKRTNKHNTEYA